MLRYRLSETAFLEQEIISEEIQIAVGTLPVHKSPGPDGMRAEFYKRYTNTV